ncbi:DUF177 domain-containing protein [Clostridium sp. D2Q-11]|uniref:DUF177 domain-containing protein n=1 Tax=Anaeromonas frigoriresistens TaxID=2683708 RepID=A0A942UZA2_9FIRM|nr:DUF177 domain-containing protein [Anaeromonas frigoriresistens]MBS4539756.1 DUF177 domain-containing protein [Anaeromonas frigoriresistens]
MKIDLSNLINGSDFQIDLDDTIEINEIKTEENDIKLTKPTVIKGGIYNTDDGIYLQAKVYFEFQSNCARCLKDTSVKEQSTLDYKIKFEDDEEEASEEELIVVSGYTLDLTEPIISSILLSLPMKTICDENCKGICPNCGRDLNEGQCNCEDKNIDPRLAKLKELMD